MARIKIKRIYEPAQPIDGFRILVDRLWPRGIKKEKAQFDIWIREVAPSPALRKWFDHDPEKWAAFSKAYKQELKQSSAIKKLMEQIRANKNVTLLFAASDKEHNHALVLQQYIDKLLL